MRTKVKHNAGNDIKQIRVLNIGHSATGNRTKDHLLTEQIYINASSSRGASDNRPERPNVISFSISKITIIF